VLEELKEEEGMSNSGLVRFLPSDEILILKLGICQESNVVLLKYRHGKT